jgi:drug/metabolite transporter (DMT)-like permease
MMKPAKNNIVQPQYSRSQPLNLPSKLTKKLAASWSFVEIILSGIGFGFLGIFGRLAFASGMTVGELLTLRFFLAAVILGLGLMVWQPRLLVLPRKQMIISCLLGIGGYAVFATMYFQAIKGVSVAIAAMLLFTFPIFVNVGAFVFLRHQMGWKQWFSLGLAIVGIVLLLWGDMTIAKVASLFWGIGAAIVYAVYVLVSGELQNKVVPISSSFFVITSAALALGAFHQPEWGRMLEFSLQQWWYVFGIATVSTIMPLTLFLSGMQKSSSSKASIIVMVEPVTAAIAGWLVLGERLGWVQVLGAILVLAALAIINQD